MHTNKSPVEIQTRTGGKKGDESRSKWKGIERGKTV
jgi:hypothetical protein